LGKRRKALVRPFHRNPAAGVGEWGRGSKMLGVEVGSAVWLGTGGAWSHWPEIRFRGIGNLVLGHNWPSLGGAMSGLVPPLGA